MADTSQAESTAEQRLQQLAAILARGVRRYWKRLRRSESRPAAETPKILGIGLEVPSETRLSGSRRSGV